MPNIFLADLGISFITEKILSNHSYRNSNYDDYDEKLKASQEAEARRQQARQQQLLQAATDSVDRILHPLGFARQGALEPYDLQCLAQQDVALDEDTHEWVTHMAHQAEVEPTQLQALEHVLTCLSASYEVKGDGPVLAMLEQVNIRAQRIDALEQLLHTVN